MSNETTIPIRSNFFTNREGNTLMKEFEGILTNNPRSHGDCSLGQREDIHACYEA